MAGELDLVPEIAASLTSASSAHESVELHDGGFDDEHRHNDHDQGHYSVKWSGEMQTFAECEGERSENRELGSEQHDPGREKAHEFRKAPWSRAEEGGESMLQGERPLQEQLQQRGGKQHDRKRANPDLIPVLGD